MFHKKKIKSLALVGCGRISRNHLKAILFLNKRVELVGIIDTNQDLLGETLNFIKEFSKERIEIKLPKTYKDYDYFLDSIERNNHNIDLIIICTPSGLHPEQVIKAASKKINVCTEKPMATNWESGLKMVKVCQENNIKLFVVKQNRFNKTLIELKKQIDNGKFGKIAMINVNVFWQRPQSYYDQASWRGTWKLDGGALMNQASHYVDLLTWLGGPLESVSASIATISRNIEVEDTLHYN